MPAIIVFLFEMGLLAFLNARTLTTHSDYLISFLIFAFSFAYAASISGSKLGVAKKPLAAGYFLRIALLYFDMYGKSIYHLPNSGADSEGFWRGSVYAARSLRKYGGFEGFMGSIFRVIGVSRLLGQFLVVLFSVVALIYAAKILIKLQVDPVRTKKAMWIMCLLPNYAILSSIYLRESIVAMFITLSLYAYVRWIKEKREIHFIFAVALTFPGAYFHSGAIAVAVGYVISRFLYDNKKEKLRISFKGIVASGLVLLIGAWVLNNFGSVFLGKFGNLEELEDIANMSTDGGSSYAAYVGNSSSIGSMVVFTIPRIVFFLFSPMPWMIRGLSDIIAFLFSGCFYLLCMWNTLRYLRKGPKKNREIVFIIFVVAMCAVFVFAWGTANTGTACRHRDKLTLVWGVLYGLTMKTKNNFVPK